jgi:hypothetical protein
VSVSDCEEVTVLQSAEMRHCDPRILVGLIRIARRLPGLCGERKFSYAVGVHLFRICSVVAVLEGRYLGLRQRMRQRRRDFGFLWLNYRSRLVIADWLLGLIRFQNFAVPIG